MHARQCVIGGLAPIFWVVVLFWFSACNQAGENNQTDDNNQMEQMGDNNQMGAQKRNWYDASLDGNAQINEACARAKSAGKHVLVQVGGDWCPWCIRLNEFITGDNGLLSVMNQNYEWVHLFFGDENRNEEAMQRLRDPGRFGFPVLVLLDADGNYMNTFSTDFFMGNDGFDRAKLLDLLQNAPAQTGQPAGGSGEEDDLDD